MRRLENISWKSSSSHSLLIVPRIATLVHQIFFQDCKMHVLISKPDGV